MGPFYVVYTFSSHLYLVVIPYLIDLLLWLLCLRVAMMLQPKVRVTTLTFQNLPCAIRGTLNVLPDFLAGVYQGFESIVRPSQHRRAIEDPNSKQRMDPIRILCPEQGSGYSRLDLDALFEGEEQGRVSLYLFLH